MRYCIAILLLLCYSTVMAKRRVEKSIKDTTVHAVPSPEPPPDPFAKSDRITCFESWVTVEPDGVLDVTENITIYNGDGSDNNNDPGFLAEGGGNNDIVRGIVRGFPTKYVNKWKLFQNTSFELKEVLQNNTPVAHTLEHPFGSNGYFLRIGDPFRQLDTGVFVYTIRYRTQYQIKFLENYDELYWNVTGDGRSFRIDSALCHVVIAGSDSSFSNACYTGPLGYNTGLCGYTRKRDTILFRTTQALKPYEGLTIASSWHKGLIAPPGKAQLWWWMLKNNIGAMGMPMLWIIILLYNLLQWRRHGRDPNPGTIIVQYEPPAGFSPSALGYIYFQGMRDRLLAAAITDAALHNVYRIELRRSGIVFKDNEYLFRPADHDLIPAGYDDFRDEARELMGTSVSKGVYNESVNKLKKHISRRLEAQYEGRSGMNKTAYFIQNARFLLFGYLFAILPFIALLVLVIAGIERNPWPLIPLVGGLLFCILTQAIFARLMPKYTTEGRMLMDKIEGYRRYLKTVDEPRLNLVNPPEKTIDLFEKNLAFAIALDCEIEWGKKFEQVIATAMQQGTSHLGLFYGNSFSAGHTFSGSSFVSSFSGAISSASTPPSSSSGGGSSFGGGSSGGGGGGGSVGGW